MRNARGRRLAVLAGLAVLTLVAACSRPTGPTGPPVTGERAPVVFVHGFGAGSWWWSGVMSQFRSRGYPAARLSAINYNSSVAIATSSEVLAQEVNRVVARTGAARVDIVSHSMGSMVTKHCIILGGCKGKVAHWNSIAGVDNGTENELIIARGTASNEDVQGRTPLRSQLQENWPALVADGVKVQVHWSPNDGIVVPGDASRQPPPAVNVEKAHLDHLSISTDRQVINEVIDFFGT